MKRRTETVTLQNTLDQIDVRGFEFDTLVLCGGEPIALNWHDCAGSIMQYLVRSGKAPEYRGELAGLRHVLAGHLHPKASLASQVFLFLQLLTPGTYILEYGTADISDLIEPPLDWDSGKDHEWFYPFDDPLVLTQHTAALSPATVQGYISAIQAGAQPIALAVTAERARCRYVIDGHHKLAAYRELDVQPIALTARRLSPPPLPKSTFAKFFSRRHPLASHYAKWKTRWDD